MIHIVIAEDQNLLSSALATILNLEDDLQVDHIAGNGKEALAQVQLHHPDILLSDIEMPEMSGLEVAEKLKSANTKVIILTTFAREGYFERAIQANVAGYLLKDTPTDDLIAHIRDMVKGKVYYAPELISGYMSQQKNPLTEREKEVLQAVSDGFSSQEIAARLFLTNGTVRNYMSEIINKLAAKNRIEAILIAKEKGWIN